MKVFLGGTCNGSDWREKILPLLQEQGIDYFNPVVDEWNKEARERELKARKTCDILLYCITPKMTGCYAIAEMVDDSNKQPEKTVFILLCDDHYDPPVMHGERGKSMTFSPRQYVSLMAVGHMITSNGGRFFTSLEDAVLSIAANVDTGA